MPCIGVTSWRTSIFFGKWKQPDSRSLQAVGVLLELYKEQEIVSRTLNGSSIVRHLGLQFSPDSPLFVRLDDQMMLVEVLDNERLLLVHREKNLLYCGVAVLES